MNNLNFSNFLREVVIPATPEDQKDSVYFEFQEWASNWFRGIPSTEVQRLVDLNVPIWLSTHDDARNFAKKLCKIQTKELGIRAAVIAARYVIEKCWRIDSENTRPIQAVELVEKWLEDESSVSIETLRELAYSKVLDGEAMYSAWAAYTTAEAATYSSMSSTAYALQYAARATSQKEICQVIVDKLPRFCYEDLLRWGYISS
jgi:hypothetical protein